MALPIALGRISRQQGVRRLTPAEWDLVGYEGPLSLHRVEHRWLFGPWRASNSYSVLHTQRGEVWSGSRKELEALGVCIDPPSPKA